MNILFWSSWLFHGHSLEPNLFRVFLFDIIKFFWKFKWIQLYCKKTNITTKFYINPVRIVFLVLLMVMGIQQQILDGIPVYNNASDTETLIHNVKQFSIANPLTSIILEGNWNMYSTERKSKAHAKKCCKVDCHVFCTCIHSCSLQFPRFRGLRQAGRHPPQTPEWMQVHLVTQPPNRQRTFIRIHSLSALCEALTSLYWLSAELFVLIVSCEWPVSVYLLFQVLPILCHPVYWSYDPSLIFITNNCLPYLCLCPVFWINLQTHSTESYVHDRMLPQTMDAADLVHLVTVQRWFLGEQERQIQEMATQIQQLSASLSQLAVQQHGSVN